MMSLRDRDRGSVTIWLALASFAMIVLVGLAVDLSGQVYAQQRAIDVAGQAARAGGQQIDTGAMRGGTVQADAAQAASAARAYLASAGVEGTVTIAPGGATIRVTTTTTYRTSFLSIIGIKTLQVSGQSDADLVRAVNGTRR